MVVENIGKGGGKTKGFGNVLQCSGSEDTSLQVEEIGDDPPHGPGTGEVSTQGRQTNYWEASLKDYRWKLGVTTFGDGDTGRGA